MCVFIADANKIAAREAGAVKPLELLSRHSHPNVKDAANSVLLFLRPSEG